MNLNILKFFLLKYYFTPRYSTLSLYDFFLCIYDFLVISFVKENIGLIKRALSHMFALDMSINSHKLTTMHTNNVVATFMKIRR